MSNILDNLFEVSQSVSTTIEPGLTKTELDALKSQSALHLTKRSAVSLSETQVMKLWRAKPKIYFRDVMDVTLDLWQEEVAELYLHNQRIGMIVVS